MTGKTALIVYHSRRGKTAAYAREIAMFLWSQGVSIRLMATTDCTAEKLQGVDYLFCGCWTSGWFVIHQYPHRIWCDFARSLPSPLTAKVFFFTTFRFRVGSMFRQMARKLGIALQPSHTIASKTGVLTNEDRQAIVCFLASTPK